MTKKNIRLIVILAILIAVAYIYQGPLKSWQANFGKPKNIFADLKVEEINKFEISEGEEVMVLEKVGDRWLISSTKDFYVRDEIANNMIASLNKAREAEVELVSENAEKKDDFRTGVSGTKVKMLQGENLLKEIVIGKMSPDYMSTYISEVGSDKTYAVKAALSSAFSNQEWHDKEIFSVEKTAINKIRFQYPTREFTVEKSSSAEASEDKGDETWEGALPYAFSVDQEKIDEILDIMSNLRAARIPEQTFEGTGLEKNSIIVQATGRGIDNILMIGDDNGEGLYYAKRGDSDNIYLITEEQRNILDKTIRDLR